MTIATSPDRSIMDSGPVPPIATKIANTRRIETTYTGISLTIIFLALKHRRLLVVSVLYSTKISAEQGTV